MGTSSSTVFFFFYWQIRPLKWVSLELCECWPRFPTVTSMVPGGQTIECRLLKWCRRLLLLFQWSADIHLAPRFSALSEWLFNLHTNAMFHKNQYRAVKLRPKCNKWAGCPGNKIGRQAGRQADRSMPPVSGDGSLCHPQRLGLMPLPH